MLGYSFAPILVTEITYCSYPNEADQEPRNLVFVSRFKHITTVKVAAGIDSVRRKVKTGMDKRRLHGSANVGKRTKQPSTDGRIKAASILMREEMKNDKRQAVVDALASKLRSKYAKLDPQFADSITAMTNRLLLHSSQRIREADIVALEAVVKKMSFERQQKRQAAGAGNGAGGEGGNSNSYSQNHSHLQQDQGGRSTSAGAGSGSTGILKELSDQDEWVLLNALTLVEFESDQDREKAKLLEKKRVQRAWLDSQRAEKAKRSDSEKQQQQMAYQHQLTDFSLWQEQQSLKKQQQLEQILKVRQERDKQLRQQRLAHEAREAQRKRDEAADVERVQSELKRADEAAQQRRVLEHERMKKLQQENAAVQAQKYQLKALEQQEDVKLMEAYARRLAKEDAERMEALQTKLKRRDEMQHVLGDSLQQQMRQKALEEDRRAEEYQRKKDDAAQLKEQLEEKKRRQDALERQQFLHLQRSQKQQREKQEVDDDLAFAQQYHREGMTVLDAQKRHQMHVRQQNREFQDQLVLQMQEQKRGQPISPLHLPRTLMNSREKHINAKLLHKLEEPEISMKVLQKLSPMKPTQSIALSTSFY